jgi:hypothetical protein
MSEHEKHMKEHDEPEADVTTEEDDDVEAHQFAAAPAKHSHGGDERERHWDKG